ncbi:monocyte chemotactic protein 1B-like [Corythoichthys intestinalis]|uniref:monocyte chemotactic protein 1B-like n=1 Tax=Corythoichthys intestinalis TaxID=161448 RepID=UPI0025A5A341|nr:monocyte chemotactic protein 1B-like [Corythoichthys intestinalis]XP_061813061.1 monocyte chemotactic protein 1B-like [Nerophis lumbriciformis]
MSSYLSLSLLAMLLVAITSTEGLRGSGSSDCCYRFNMNPVPQTRVVSYVKTSQQCPIAAFRLKTVNGRYMCVKSSVQWVKDLINELDARKISGETTNL